MLNKESDKESYLDDSDNERLSGEETFTKKKKGKKGRKGKWLEHFVDDLVDVILDEEKLKEKLLLTNVKNKKNGQYYGKVIELISLRCKERNEEFSFSVAQTRQKFKRCINICRDAVMKVKTASVEIDSKRRKIWKTGLASYCQLSALWIIVSLSKHWNQEA